MKETINTYFSWIFKAGLTVVTFSTLFLFTNLTTDLYDTPKFLILLTFTTLMLLLLTLKFVLTGKVNFVKTPLDLPLILLAAVALVSTIVSPSPYVSLLGNGLRIHPSAAAIILYVLFYFVLINCLKSAREIKWILNLLTWGCAVLAVISLLSYWGVKLLPPPWVQTLNFTPAGSSFSATAILALLIPVVTAAILTDKFKAKILNAIFLALFGLTIALTGNLATWVAGAFGFIMVLLNLPLNKPAEAIARLGPVGFAGITLPLTLVLIASALSFIPPVGKTQNPFYNQAKNFPREIQLPFNYSWKISVSSFRDSPVWGSGPGTYAFDFTRYKPVEINSTRLWNLRFEGAFNEYLQTLATLGGVGFLALIAATVFFVSFALKAYRLRTNASPELTISSAAFFILMALHSLTLPVWVIGIVVLAGFFIINHKFEEYSETAKIEALPSVLLTASTAAILFVFFFAGKFALADYHHRRALEAVSQNQGVVAYNELVAAERLNPYSDLYRTDLAQTNFALANAIAAAKGPTEASPGGSLTEADKQNIQVLLQQSISEGKVATTLSPNSAANWEILASLYRQIQGVAQNALQFSLDAYGRAIALDPLNPLLRTAVGGIYYQIKNYDLAIRFFTDSINLKPDFANGYYNLSVALRDKGDLQNAQLVAERVLTLVDPGSVDYKVASDYLEDLKNRIASGSAQQSPIKAPASETSGALQQKELPDVVNVGNPPEKIATPPAVQKSSP